MRILIFNWRDIRNPAAGGAEVFTHENAKRWIKLGHSVTIFTSGFTGGRKEEVIDGVRIVRRGNRFSVYYHALRFYKKGQYDVVIDEINTIPFFTPLFVKEKKIALIHQLAREFWLYEVLILGVFGYILEPLYMRLYSKVKTVTVSESTKKDLVSLGFRDVSIVSEGIGFKPLDKVPLKEKDFTMIFVGRMKKAKKPMDAVKAFIEVRKKVPSARLWMVGNGYYSNFPEIDGITYFGKVDNDKKHELMAKAHVLLVPAVREGWGLVVTEANALGTPAVGYNVPGLRDSVKDRKTGLLCVPDPSSMASCAIDLWKDKKKLHDYSSNALKDSRKYTWEKGAKQFLESIANANVCARENKDCGASSHANIYKPNLIVISP